MVLQVHNGITKDENIQKEGKNMNFINFLIKFWMHKDS